MPLNRTERPQAESPFWELAEPLLKEPGVRRATLMGWPCLRQGDAFFATVDHRTGEMIVKLTAARVNELIEAEIGQPFAPAGRVFREWALIPLQHQNDWPTLLDEARRIALEAPPRPPARPRGPSSRFKVQSEGHPR